MRYLAYILLIVAAFQSVVRIPGPGGSGAAYSPGVFVKACNNQTTSTTSPVCNFPGNGTIGNMIMAYTATDASKTLNSATSTCTGSFTIAKQGSGVALIYATVTSAASCSITGTMNASGDVDFMGREVSGVTGLDPNASAEAVSNPTSTTPSISITVTNTNDYVFCDGADLNVSNSTLSVGSGFTQREVITNGGFHALGQEEIFSGSGSFSCTLNSTNNTIIGIGAMAFH